MVKKEQEVAAFLFVAVPVEGAGGREQPFVYQFTAVVACFDKTRAWNVEGRG